MAADDRDSSTVQPGATGTRFTAGDGPAGAGALVGDLQTGGNQQGGRKDIVDVLQDLVECCKDGEYGFRTSAERTGREDLRSVLSQRAEDFRAAGEELNRLVADCGGTPERSGSAMGAVHRGWVAMQATFGDNDKAVLQGAERGQDNALARYRKALEKPLPGEIRSVVERQMQLVQECHDQMKMLRDQARAG